MLIGFQLNNNNVAKVDDPESSLQPPLAELNDVKRLADYFEQLFELAGGLEKRINAQLRLSPPRVLEVGSSRGRACCHIQSKTIKII